MARSKRNVNPTVLVIFYLIATLAAEHRDSSTTPFRKPQKPPHEEAGERDGKEFRLNDSS